MMGAVRDNLQQNLNYYLKENKMTQKKLSELLDVSQAAVTNWTKGKNSPDIIPVSLYRFHNLSA